MSIPAQVAAAIVVVAAVVLTVVIYVADSFSDDPSSTAILIVPFMALYAMLAIGVIWAADAAVRAVARRKRRKPSVEA